MQQAQDSSQQRQRDLLPRRLPDSSLRQALQVAPQLELALVRQAVLLLRVHLAVAAAVLARDLWQEVARCCRWIRRRLRSRTRATGCRRAELAQTKPTRTRVKRDR